MLLHWHVDGEPVCEVCAPQDVEGDADSNECDSPENCSVCSRPCNYSLTTAWVSYVIEKLEEALLDKIDDTLVDAPGDYYHGSRRVEVLRDWALDLKSYFLSKEDQAIVDHFLEVTHDNEASDPDCDMPTYV